MAALGTVEKLGDAEFKWGKKKGTGAKDKTVQFYESFTYDGVEYKLNDCIYMHKDGEDEPYIGKMIKIWEKQQSKMVKIQWFFRPSEIWYWLKQHNQKALQNEVFFASGDGKGLANSNHLEAIAGKCNVVCISKDPRNPQPSKKQLQGADYVFYRTFDVGKCITSEDFGDKVGDLEVKFVFNTKENEKSENVKEKAANGLEGQMKEFIEPKNEKKIVAKADESSNNAKPKRSLESTSGLDGPSKKKANGNLTMVSNLSPKKETHEEKKSKAILESPRLEDNPSIMTSSTDKSIEKKDKSIDSLDLKVTSREETLVKKKSAPLNNSTTFASHASKEAIIEGRVIEVTQRPDDDEGRWFHLPPWEKRMLAASDQSTLVMLLNLDPEYTSADVEDIIWHAFREKCSAKVVQQNAFSSPHIGRALLIFKSREAAERVVKRLNEGCLVLSNQRPLVGRNFVLPKNYGKQSKFAGHLVIDKLKHQQQRDKDAVSTSHCAQPNTIEHELAMEWCLLQARSDIWWKKLNEQQGKELKRLSSGLKSNN